MTDRYKQIREEEEEEEDRLTRIHADLDRKANRHICLVIISGIVVGISLFCFILYSINNPANKAGL
jgi:hypothetical protein